MDKKPSYTPNHIDLEMEKMNSDVMAMKQSVYRELEPRLMEEFDKDIEPVRE